MRATVKQLRQSKAMRTVKNIARRFVVSLAPGADLWQLLGYESGQDEQEKADDVEVFSQYGLASRPKAGSDTEVIVIKVGGESGHPVVIASRDKSIQVSLDGDEVAIFNSTGALVKVCADGTIELGDSGLGATDGVVHGAGIDPFTGSTYTALGNTSGVVRAKK